MLMAYVRATRFDVLSRVTYNWRVREDLTSTGQQKHKLDNLFDRILVKEEAHELLRNEASVTVYDAWVARTLDVDFPAFIVSRAARAVCCTATCSRRPTRPSSAEPAKRRCAR